MSEYPVKVHIYDISKGLARSMSRALIGKQIDGIWHTGIVVHGQEFFFGGDGINNCPPCGTILGPPDSIVDLGTTQIPIDIFMDYLSELSQTNFRPECYHLLDHNCNNFSSEVAQFLTGRDIPAHITNLPSEVLQTPMGAMLKAFIDNMSSGFGHPTFGANRNSNNQNNTETTASSVPSSTPDKPSQSPQEGAAVNTNSVITFNDAKVDILSVKDILKAGDKDLACLEEICEYVSTEKCSWSLGKTHFELIEKLLLRKDVPREKKVKLLEILQKLVLSEDTMSLFVHYHLHGLMEFACDISQLRRPEQINVLKVLSNCCQTQKGVDWLLNSQSYTISTIQTNNCQITGGCCVFSLLQEQQEVKETGVTLSHNLTMYTLSDDTSVEIGSAILQCLMGDVTEVAAYRCLAALKSLMASNQEVTDLACVMGVDLTKLRKMSSRIESLAKDMEPLLQ